MPPRAYALPAHLAWYPVRRLADEDRCPCGRQLLIGDRALLNRKLDRLCCSLSCSDRAEARAERRNVK